MEGTDHYVITWRKSSFSNANGGNCVEVGVAWHKSSFSESNGGNCVEVGVPWRKSSFSDSQGGSCVEVGPTVDAILVRDTKNRSAGTLAFAATAWHALTTTLANQPRR